MFQLTQDDTAVATGINCSKILIDNFIKHIQKITGFEFLTSKNKFKSLTTCKILVKASDADALNALTISLMKIAN